jgi:methylphosphotriester-DNA--protein-cysteine methyltransferase
VTLDSQICYRALRARDARFDGRFFVAVSSTRIYCRPVCTVKPPRRENCRFYPSAAAAESAGYRPCLRCRPELAPGNASVDATTRVAQAAASLIEDRTLDEDGLDAVAARRYENPEPVLDMHQIGVELPEQRIAGDQYTAAVWKKRNRRAGGRIPADELRMIQHVEELAAQLELAKDALRVVALEPVEPGKIGQFAEPLRDDASVGGHLIDQQRRSGRCVSRWWQHPTPARRR